MLIGISGKARVGKDTVGRMLAEELFVVSGRKFTLMAYATMLKQTCQKNFDLSYDQLWGDQKEVEDQRYPKKEGGFWTPREIIQFYGTDCMRTIDPNFWVRSLFNVIKENNFEDIIITDVRFIDEAEPVKKAGGYIINVNSNRCGMEEINGKNHISENALNNYEGVDFHILNNSGFDELRDSVKEIVSFIKVNERLKSKIGGQTNG